MKFADFSSFSFLIVSTTCTGIPYKFLSISKLVRTLSEVSVVAATPMRRTNQVLGGRIRTPQDESDLLMTNQDPARQITASQNESGSHRTNHGLP